MADPRVHLRFKNGLPTRHVRGGVNFFGHASRIYNILGLLRIRTTRNDVRANVLFFEPLGSAYTEEMFISEHVCWQ